MRKTDSLVSSFYISDAEAKPSTMNTEILKEIVTHRMPFGKYKNTLLADLPISYLEWFMRKGGFPPGKLGQQLSTVYEIKLNGLTDIITELKKRYANRLGWRTPSNLLLFTGVLQTLLISEGISCKCRPSNRR